MDKQQLRPKRHLGQNFLVDTNVLGLILNQAQPLKGEKVLEVGPGTGVLTRALLEQGARVVAVEADYRLSTPLREELGEGDRFTLIEGDILKLDLTGLLKEHGVTKVVSNLPYSITTPLLYRLCTVENPPRQMVLMVQMETAQRITATFGQKRYSALGVLVSFLYQAEMAHRVSPNSFRPRPKVESAILGLEIRAKIPNHSSRVAARRVISWGFSHPRKMALKSLTLAAPGVDWKGLLKSAGIQPTGRPHQIPPHLWLELAKRWRETGAGVK